MFGIVCPQCKKASNGAVNRLVRDSCGHEKCRVCLLRDEEQCQQCKKENVKLEPPEVSFQSPDSKNKSQEPHSVIKCESHTGVITCNGTAKKSSICSFVQNGGVDKKRTEIKQLSISPIIKSKNKTAKSVPNKKLFHNVLIPNHVTILKDPTQYKCNICNKQFTTKAHIKYHLYCTGRKSFLIVKQ